MNNNDYKSHDALLTSMLCVISDVTEEAMCAVAPLSCKQALSIIEDTEETAPL